MADYPEICGGVVVLDKRTHRHSQLPVVDTTAVPNFPDNIHSSALSLSLVHDPSHAVRTRGFWVAFTFVINRFVDLNEYIFACRSSLLA
jgi:hypothetical protein